MKKLIALTIALIVMALGTASAQASTSYIGYLGPNCYIGSYTGLNENDRDELISEGLIESWKRVETGTQISYPCTNVIPITHTQYEHCNSTCQTNDEGSIVGFAKSKLMAAYNCNGNSCTMNAGDTYVVNVTHYDYVQCRSYHWDVSFITANESVWATQAIPEFTTQAITHGAGGSCWAPLYGCAQNEDD